MKNHSHRVYFLSRAFIECGFSLVVKLIGGINAQPK